MGFVKTFLFTFLAFASLKYLAVVYIDPYKVFQFADFNQKNFAPNHFFMKVEHLKKNDYEGIVLGTSRGNSYRSVLLDELTGKKFYNLSSLNFKLRNIEELLNWIKKNKTVLPKEVIFTLDFDLMFLAEKLPTYPIQIMPHPDTDGEYWDFYTKNLSISLATLGETVKVNRSKDTFYTYNSKTGNYNEFTDKDNTLRPTQLYPEAHKITWAKDYEAKIKPNDLQKMDVSCFDWENAPIKEYSKNKFREIHQLILDMGIRPIYVVNPLLKEYSFDLKRYTKWLEYLKDTVGEFWHFGGYNHHALSKIYYYEESHFDFFLGDQALRKIYGKSNDEFKDFGIKVNQKNFKSFMQTLMKRNFLRYGRKCKS